MIHFTEYFISPVYRGPLIGSILMCLVASIVGIFVFLKKRSLVSETLSHASFPGVVIGVFLASFFIEIRDPMLSIFIMVGAILFSSLSYFMLEYLEKKTIIKNDTALCYLLAFFFALGLLITSQMQFVAPLFYKKSLSFLYGQVATMTDQHIFLYGALLVFSLVLIILFYYPIKALLFDSLFFQGLGFSRKLIEGLISLLLLLAIVTGISSVGVVLLSGMLIAPCVAARQWTSKFLPLFFLSAFFGALSAVVGVIGSIELSLAYSLSFPTGPSIVFVASLLSLLSLLIAPKRGYLFRCYRLYVFKIRCIEENILKGIWQYSLQEKRRIKKFHSLSFISLFFLLIHMKYLGWIFLKEKKVYLTKDGENKAKKIVRLHRLWEVYLADHLGIGVEKVHKSAEQIEHLLTEDLEKKLTQFLDDPKEDPHNKPIPTKEL